MGKPFHKPHLITGGTHVVIVGWSGTCRDRSQSAGDRWDFAAAFDIVSGAGKRRLYLTSKGGVTGSDRYVSSPAMPIAKKIAGQAWDSLVAGKGKGAKKIPVLPPGVLCRSWLDSGKRTDPNGMPYNSLSRGISTRDYSRWSYDAASNIAITVGPTGDLTEDGLWPRMWVVQDGEVIRRAVIDLEPTD